VLFSPLLDPSCSVSQHYFQGAQGGCDAPGRHRARGQHAKRCFAFQHAFFRFPALLQFKFPWRMAGQLEHRDDVVDSDQKDVNKELSLPALLGPRALHLDEPAHIPSDPRMGLSFWEGRPRYFYPP